jgi:hypothetical protein
LKPFTTDGTEGSSGNNPRRWALPVHLPSHAEDSSQSNGVDPGLHLQDNQNLSVSPHKGTSSTTFVYCAGHAVAGARVDGLLKPMSLVPTIVSDLEFYSQSTQPDQWRHRIPSVSNLNGSEKGLMFPR